MKKFLLSILSILAVALSGHAVVQVSVDPAPGEVTQVPQTIKVTTDVNVFFNATNPFMKGEVKFTDADGNSYNPTYSLATNSLGMAKEFDVTLNQAYTTPGTYTLWFKANSLLADEYADNANAEQTFTWTVVEGGSTEPETPELDPDHINFLSVNPAEGAVAEIPAEIWVTTDTDLYIGTSSSAQKKFHLTDANGNTYAVTAVAKDNDGNYSYESVRIKLTNGAITADGTYTLTFDEGALKDNATKAFINLAKSFTWTIGGSSEPEKPTAVNILNVTPAEGTVEELSSILVEVDQPIVMHPMADFSLVDEAGTYYLPTRELADPDGDGVIKHAKFTFETPITAAGTYTFSMSENALANMEMQIGTPATTYTYTIEGGDDTPTLDPDHINFLSINPAEGTVAEIPAEIWVTTDTDLYIGTSNSAQNKFHLTDANGNTYAVTAVAKDNDGNYSYESVRIKLTNGAITADGTYTLTFDEGALKEQNNVTFINLAKSFTWTIGGGSAPAEPVVTMTPAEGETLDALSKVTVTCDQGIAVVEKYLAYCAVFGSTSTTQFTSYNQVDANTVELVLANEITDGGEYEISIYTGALTLAPNATAQAYPANTLKYKVNVSGALAVKLEVTPANESTLETVQHFSVTFAKGIMVHPEPTELPFLGYTDPTTGASEQIELTVGATTETSVTLSTAAEQTKAGYYTLVIPAGFFVLENMYLNEYIMCQYNVTGKEEPGPGSDYIQILRVDPAEGTVTEIPYTIYLYTDTDLGSTLFSEMSLTDANGNEYGFHSSGNNDSDDNGSYDRAWVKLADMQPITAPGTYTLTVKPGALGEYNNLSKTNEEVSFTWTIEGGETPDPAETFDLVSVPEAGEVPLLPSKLYVYAGEEIVNADPYDLSKITLTDANGNNYVQSAGAVDYDGDAKYDGLYIRIASGNTNITTAGTYTLNIAEGLVTLKESGKVNKEAAFTWTVTGETPVIEFIKVDPAEGVVEEIPTTITVYTDTDLDMPDKSLMSLTDANGNSYEITGTNWGVDVFGTGFIYLAEAITAPGTYTLTLQAGALQEYYGTKVNEEKSFTWTIEAAAPEYIQIVKTVPEVGVVSEIPTTIGIYTDTDLVGASYSKMSLKDANGTEYQFAESGVTDPQGDGFYECAYVMLAKAITDPGTYTLTVEEGAITQYNGPKVNEAFSLTWTIEGGETPELDPDHINILSIDPAEGTVAELPAEIWVKTDTDLYIGTSNSAQNKFHLTDANGNTYAVTAVSKDNDGNYTYESVKVTLADGAITAPGTYTLTFDEGALKDYNDRTFINLAKSFTWTIEDTSAELIQVLSVDPAEGVVEVLPRTIDIFTDTDLVAATVSQMTMKDASGNEYAVMEATPGDSDQNGSYDRLRISLAQEITTPGTYTLTIPAGTIQEMGGGRTNAELTFTWTVAAVEYIEVYSVDPEEGNRPSLPALISIYTNADIISVAESKVSLVDDKGNNHALKITAKDTDYNETAETVEFELVNGAISTQGTYTLTIEKGAMVDYSDPNLTNNTLVFVWEVEGTGIAGIEAGVDGYVVYDLNGYLVMQTRDAADLRQLERGFYIINGKKVVLNK